MKAKLGTGFLALVAMVVLLSLIPLASAGGLNLTVTDYEPTALSHTYGGDWVNFSWSSTNVNDTDGFNATITDCSNTALIGNWYNVSSGTGTVDWATDQVNAFLNVSLANHETVSIKVWAYNYSSGLSANSSVDSGMAQDVVIHNLEVADYMSPNVDNSVAVNVTDAMDSDDTATLTLTFWRHEKPVYYRELHIFNNGSAIPSQVFEKRITYAFLDGVCQEDFEDIRIKNKDTGEIYPHYFEEVSIGDYVDLVFRVGNLSKGWNNGTYILEYGRSDAVNISSFNDTIRDGFWDIHSDGDGLKPVLQYKNSPQYVVVEEQSDGDDSGIDLYYNTTNSLVMNTTLNYEAYSVGNDFLDRGNNLLRFYNESGGQIFLIFRAPTGYQADGNLYINDGETGWDDMRSNSVQITEMSGASSGNLKITYNSTGNEQWKIYWNGILKHVVGSVQPNPAMNDSVKMVRLTGSVYGTGSTCKANITFHNLPYLYKQSPNEGLSVVGNYPYGDDAENHTVTDDAENHYTVTYDINADSLSSSPSGYVTKTASINTADVQPELGFTFNPADYAAPSYGTENTTQNNYVWTVKAELSVNGQGTGNHTLSDNDSVVLDKEMTAFPSMTVSGNQLIIEEQCVPGGTYQFSPDLVLENKGNVPLDLNKSMTNLTADSGVIPAGNIYLDDDPNHDESTETNLVEEAYTNAFQLWGMKLDTHGTDTKTVYNFIEIPEDTKSGFYTGTWTYKLEENWT